MNALVNDQLGRLRLMFGDTRTVRMFEGWAGRPARFAGTPAAPLCRRPFLREGRQEASDHRKPSSAPSRMPPMRCPAPRGRPARRRTPAPATCTRKLSKRGKWPSKESVSAWFGKPGTHWPGKNKQSKRGVLRPHDAELITRHEVQENPPDLLITNYSMLEYMMLRPIERRSSTRPWSGCRTTPRRSFLSSWTRRTSTEAPRVRRWGFS